MSCRNVTEANVLIHLEVIYIVLKHERGISVTLIPLHVLSVYVIYFFFLLNWVPANPARPTPKRSIVAGSGTGAAVKPTLSMNPP